MKTMVITGGARGFGREIALLAKQDGYNVLATVRKFDEAAKSLQEAGITCELMEMHDPVSIDAFAEKAIAWCSGKLDVLINNAGLAYPGPVELITREDLLAQFQINVFGHIQLTQRLLSSLKAQRGRIIMVSSQSALLTAPMVGAYSASKRALEALTEALVMETGGAVEACLVRPGPFATSIWDHSVAIGQGHDYDKPPYKAMADAIQSLARKGPMGNPLDLARLVIRILHSHKMRFIYGAPFSAKMTMGLRRLLPAKWFFALSDFILSKEMRRQAIRPPASDNQSRAD